jgi:hypothetical protein
MAAPLSVAGGFQDGAAESLAWWDEPVLEALSRCVQAAWTQWTNDWIGGAGFVGSCTCTLAHANPDAAQAHWEPLGARKQAAAWIEVRPNSIEHIQEAIFGPEHHCATAPGRQGGIAQEVAARAWASLANDLRNCLSVDRGDPQRSPERACFQPWSGFVRIGAPAGGPLAHSLLLNAECVRAIAEAQIKASSVARLPQSSSTVTPLRDALADHKLAVQVELAECELELGMLSTLRIGDIVPLAHALDAPLLISTSRQDRLCAGFLGRHSGAKAIELQRATVPTLGGSPNHHP